MRIEHTTYNEAAGRPVTGTHDPRNKMPTYSRLSTASSSASGAATQKIKELKDYLSIRIHGYSEEDRLVISNPLPHIPQPHETMSSDRRRSQPSTMAQKQSLPDDFQITEYLLREHEDAKQRERERKAEEAARRRALTVERSVVAEGWGEREKARSSGREMPLAWNNGVGKAGKRRRSFNRRLSNDSGCAKLLPEIPTEPQGLEPRKPRQLKGDSIMRAPSLKRTESFDRLSGRPDVCEKDVDTGVLSATDYRDYLRVRRAITSSSASESSSASTRPLAGKSSSKSGLLNVPTPSSSTNSSRVQSQISTSSKTKPSASKTTRRHSKNSKSSSTTAVLTSYVENGADLLDATRRELTSSIVRSAHQAFSDFKQSELSHLRKPFAAGDKTSKYPDRDSYVTSDSDSDESFFCVGEGESRRKINRDSQEGKRSTAELEKARRLSGAGTKDPWTSGRSMRCRLCRKDNPTGVRGLCQECEEDFQNLGKMFDDDDEEVKPPVPLKIKRKPIPTPRVSAPDSTEEKKRRDERQISNPVEKPHRLSGPYEDHIPPFVSADKDRSHSALDHTPESSTVNPQSQEQVSGYERWQTPEIRKLYENSEESSTRWSLSLLSENGENSDSCPSLRSRFSERKIEALEDVAPGGGERKGGRQRRSSGFYQFWEEVLNDDRDKRSRWEGRDWYH